MGTVDCDKPLLASSSGGKNLLELLWKQREEDVTGGMKKELYMFPFLL